MNGERTNYTWLFWGGYFAFHFALITGLPLIRHLDKIGINENLIGISLALYLGLVGFIFLKFIFQPSGESTT